MGVSWVEGLVPGGGGGAGPKSSSSEEGGGEGDVGGRVEREAGGREGPIVLSGFERGVGLREGFLGGGGEREEERLRLFARCAGRVGPTEGIALEKRG